MFCTGPFALSTLAHHRPVNARQFKAVQRVNQQSIRAGAQRESETEPGEGQASSASGVFRQHSSRLLISQHALPAAALRSAAAGPLVLWQVISIYQPAGSASSGGGRNGWCDGQCDGRQKQVASQVLHQHLGESWCPG